MARTKQTARKSTGGKPVPRSPAWEREREQSDAPSDRPNNDANLIHAEKIVPRRSPVHLIPFDASRKWWQFIDMKAMYERYDRPSSLLFDPSTVYDVDQREELVDMIQKGDAEVLFTRDLARIDETKLTGTWCVNPVIDLLSGEIMQIEKQILF